MNTPTPTRRLLLAAVSLALLVRIPPPDLAASVAVGEPAVAAQPAPPARFGFRAENVPIKQALALFAKANGLNIVPDLDVVGDVTVEFEDLPLDLAMQALLEANGYYFVREGALLRVRGRQTRLFHIDYIHATRSGQGSSAVQISSGGGSAGGAGGAASAGASAGSEGSTMTVTNNSTINFWGDLSEQIKSMLSETGSVTINSLAGTVLVSDSYRTLQNVAAFLESVTESIVRQIDLEVQIYEVAMSKGFQLGIDWSRLGAGLDTQFATGLIVRNPAFGPAVLESGLTVNQVFQKGIDGVLEALSQQGRLKVVSKPRLRTLNNQPAVVRVGQDLPVFLRQSIASTGDNPVITENITIQTITVGTVLSITPQVSADGRITLDLSPAVSRLVRMESSGGGPDATTAPVIDIRQASSIVRVRDGDTVVMGGLVQDGESTTVRKVPLLGDIPLLGRAFSGEVRSSERTELVFFLTPRIVNDRDPSNQSAPRAPDP